MASATPIKTVASGAAKIRKDARAGRSSLRSGEKAIRPEAQLARHGPAGAREDPARRTAEKSQITATAGRARTPGGDRRSRRRGRGRSRPPSPRSASTGARRRRRSCPANRRGRRPDRLDLAAEKLLDRGDVVLDELEQPLERRAIVQHVGRGALHVRREVLGGRRELALVEPGVQRLEACEAHADPRGRRSPAASSGMLLVRLGDA